MIIADDLTGGADTGVKFAEKGLKTHLISYDGQAITDLARHSGVGVLVANTCSRSLPPSQAFSRVRTFLDLCDPGFFPIIYKKIDSTLRGNIGTEIDAILEKTKAPLALVAPSLPAQERTLVQGQMLVSGRPLSSSEIARDIVSPVNESHVPSLIAAQSRHPVGWIDLVRVAAGGQMLHSAVMTALKTGKRILVLDTQDTNDLVNITHLALRMEQTPLLVGSAGLAEEVAKLISIPEKRRSTVSQLPLKSFHHFFFVSGSASAVTRDQLQRIRLRFQIPLFELERSFFTGDEKFRQQTISDFSFKMAHALSQGHAILQICSERIFGPEIDSDYPPEKIVKYLGQIAVSTLGHPEIKRDSLVMVMTGGDTALALITQMGTEIIEIQQEMLNGIILCRLIGGDANEVAAITKAGAFGKANALEQVMERFLSLEGNRNKVDT